MIRQESGMNGLTHAKNNTFFRLLFDEIFGEKWKNVIHGEKNFQ